MGDQVGARGALHQESVGPAQRKWRQIPDYDEGELEQQVAQRPR